MELMIAMAILAILAGVGFSSFAISSQKARDAQRKADLEQLQRALELYQADFQLYPEELSGRVAGCGDGTGVCAWGEAFSVTTSEFSKVYMKAMPLDPVAAQAYIYVVSTDRKQYQLFARLENGNDPATIAGLTETCGNQTCNYGVASANALPTEILP